MRILSVDPPVVQPRPAMFRQEAEALAEAPLPNFVGNAPGESASHTWFPRPFGPAMMKRSGIGVVRRDAGVHVNGRAQPKTRLSPVISAGLGRPMRWRTVGAMSARRPPLRIFVFPAA